MRSAIGDSTVVTVESTNRYGLSANVRKLGGMGRHELSDAQ
jgi:hypothetical protein